MSDINVGNNANLLKGAIDSHDTHINNDNRVTNNIVNNTNTQTVYEAQRSQLEIQMINENEFIKAVRMHLRNGLTHQKEAELDLIARDWHISPIRAKQIIDAERKSAEILSRSQGNQYYSEKVLQNIIDAVYANQTDIIKHLFKSVEELSHNTDDNKIQYYYYMLYASLNPTGCVVSFVSHRTDNYWQYFWTYIAYVKLGQIQKTTELISRLGTFGGPRGDIDLLYSVGNLYDVIQTQNEYYKQQLHNNLQNAVTQGMSEQLSPLWYALQELTKQELNPETWFAFYVETTLMELTPLKNKQATKERPAFPEIPNYDVQSIQLKQSQGWNPLQAAQQIGLGQIPSISDLQAQLNAIQNQAMNAIPQMPDMSMGLNMPQMPALTETEATEPTSGESELVIPDRPQAVPTDRLTQYGIILTDSLSLAEKYGCEVQKVYQVLNVFIDNSARIEQYWYLLDMGRHRQILGNKAYWGDYNEILSKYIEENGFQTGLATPVFIIGGSDVIPVPQLENPQYSGLIPSDMAYCFHTTFFSDLWEGDRCISSDYVRNTISRLPLECGQIQPNIEDDLLSYFNLCSLVEDGIEMEGVVMTSNVEWTENSVTMSQHLPLIYTKTNDSREIYKRMYMCPKLIVHTEEGNVDHKVLNDYETALQHAGMLLFNLHGSDSKGQSGFYCRDENGCYPESFNIELMQRSNARVFNTVACFGARYDGYDRNDSMLMSSLFGGGKLLYAGSTVAVPMIPDEDQNYPENATRHPGSGSEKFMPIYCYYQFCGLPAGQAMMRAKLDYFNTYRYIERDDFSLSTIMMFGLYGNPMLSLKVRQDVINEALRCDLLPQVQSEKLCHIPVCMKYKKCLISKEQLRSSKSLLDQLRNCVDEHLNAIHGMVQQNLYQQLGLDPRWLDEVDVYEMHNTSGELLKGYLYHYDDENKFGRKAIIEVSPQGEVTRKITFK